MVWEFLFLFPFSLSSILLLPLNVHTHKHKWWKILFFICFSRHQFFFFCQMFTHAHRWWKIFFFVCLFVPSILLLQLLSELLIHVSGVRIPFSFLPCSIFTHNDGVIILLFIYFHLTNLFYLSNNVLWNS